MSGPKLLYDGQKPTSRRGYPSRSGRGRTIVAVNPLVVLFLAVIVAVGYLLTFLLEARPGTADAGAMWSPLLRVEERLAYGVVLGSVAVSTVGFFIAWVLGVSRGTMLLTMALAVGALAPTASLFGTEIAKELASIRPRLALPVRDRASLRPVALVLALSAVVTIRIVTLAYTSDINGGVRAGHLATFGDWSAHLAYTGSFAYADNFPPELPTAAGEAFAYHFGVNWFAAMFVPLGVSLPGSLELTSALLGTVFPVVMYLASLRFVRSRTGAMLGTFVFLASGGTGALRRFFFEDVPDALTATEGARPDGLRDLVMNLPRTYAFDGFDRNWVDNSVTGFLYTQRPTMFGFAMVFIVLAVLWQSRAERPTRVYVVLGAFVAVMPFFHVFAFGVLVVLTGTWAVIERRADPWWRLLAPALAVGIPVVLWQRPEQDGVTRHFGWVIGLENSSSSYNGSVTDFVVFWWTNTGPFIPLAFWGLWRMRHLRWRFAPIFGLLLIPNVAIWHFWEGNNVKYVIFFLLLASPFVGEALAAGFRGHRDYYFLPQLLAGLAVVSLTLSGGLDIWNAFEGSSGAYPAGYMSAGDVLVGEWARDRTEPDAVFASANTFMHPVRVVAGRTVVSGAAGRLNDLGVDWQTRDADLRVLYQVAQGFDEIIDRWDIDYLVLGPLERQSFRPPDAPDDWDPALFWDGSAVVVYDVGGYKVYDVRQYQS